MKRYLERIGITGFLLLATLAVAQAFSLFPFQFGFMKGGNIKYEDLTVSATFDPLSSYTFANTTTGKTHEASFRVTNGGNDTLQNYSTSATGTSFSKYSSPSGNITAGSYADVKFRFAPVTAGTFDGSILWTAPNMTSKTFHLHGTGVCLAPSQTTSVSAGSETSSGFTVTFTAGANSTSSSLEYGTTTAYGTTINPATSPQAITGLSAETLYHYRVNAINACSTVNGADGTATTAAAACTTPTGTSLTESFGDAASSCWATGPSTCDNTWTVVSGTPSIVTASGTPPDNTVCANALRFNGAAEISKTFTSIPSGTSVDTTFYIYITTGANLDYQQLLVADNGAGQIPLQILWRWVGSAPAIEIYNGSDASTTITLSTTVWHKVKMHIDTTAANSYLQVDDGTQYTLTANAYAYAKIILKGFDSNDYQIGALAIN